MKKIKLLIMPVLLLAVLVITSSSASATVLTSGWHLSNIDNSSIGLPNGTVTEIVMNILNWLLMIFGVAGVIGFIISGLMYILAAGDEKVMEKAKNAMKWSIIGVVVGLAGVVAIGAIEAILNGGWGGQI